VGLNSQLGGALLGAIESGFTSLAHSDEVIDTTIAA
jgi:hypothetical protein